MSLVRILTAVQKSHFSHGLAEANHMLVAVLQLIHVLGFILLLAPLIFIGLRLFGLVLREYSLDATLPQPRTLSICGLVMTLTSGVLMFLSAPLHYYYNWAFDTKMELLLAALIAYGVLFLGAAPRGAAHPLPAKITAALSVLLLVCVCMAARAIGFVA